MKNESNETFFDVYAVDRYNLASISSISALIMNIALISLIISRSALRNISNAIICSSCFSCLFYAVITICNSISWRVAELAVKKVLMQCFFGPLAGITCGAIVNSHLVVTCLERCFRIMYPFKYARALTIRNLTIILLLVWLTPILLIYMANIIHGLSQYNSCTVWYDKIELVQKFDHAVLALIFYIPPLILLITYIVIICKISSMQYMIRLNMPIEPNSSIKLLRILKHKKALIQMTLFLVFYLFAVTPFYFTHIALKTDNSQSLETFRNITYLNVIGYLWIHPILIFYFTASLKNEAKKVIRIWRKNYKICYICPNYDQIELS